MAQEIIDKKMTINFGDNTWSSKEDFTAWPQGFVHVMGHYYENGETFDMTSDVDKVVFNGNKGGIDVYSMVSDKDFSMNENFGYGIIVGDMKKWTNGVRNTGKKAEDYATDGTGYKGKLVINGGVYKAVGPTIIYVTNGVCEINGGTFFAQPDSTMPVKSEEEREEYGDYRNYSLNLYGKTGDVGQANIIVKGGTFIGFDPGNTYADKKRNFVAEGYKSVKREEKYTYTIKDKNRADNGTLVSVDVYDVVPENA